MILVPFSLEWEAVKAAGPSGAHQVAHARRLVGFWGPHGVLVVLGGAEGKARFRAAIEALPQPARVMWKLALRRFRDRTVFSDAVAVDDLYERADVIKVADAVALVGASDERCDLLGVAVDEIGESFADGRVEIARLLCLEQSETIQRARHLAEQNLERGQSPGDLWESRFQPLVPYAGLMVIVDRYAGQDVVRQASGKQSGLEFVLRRAWQAPLHIHAYMADPRPAVGDPAPVTLDRFRDAVDQLLGRLRTELGARSRELKIFRCDDRDFRDLAHDRYLRLSSWLFHLDVGLEPFSHGGSRRARSPFRMCLCQAEELRARQKLEERLELKATGRLIISAGVD